MKQRTLLLLILASITLWSCKEEEPYKEPEFTSLMSKDITNSGATLTAELRTGSEEIIAYGFVWKYKDTPSLEDPASEKQVVTGTLDKDSFSLPINTKIETGESYTYRAFAKTKSKTYYSYNNYLATPYPSIDSISPTSGIEGSIVTIYGKFFNPALQENEILINSSFDTIVKPIEASENHLKFRMPSSDNSIMIMANIKKKRTDNNYMMTNAVYFNHRYHYSFSPNKVKVGQQLTLHTQGGGHVNTTFTIGGVEAKVTGYSFPTLYRAEITVKVPENLEPGEAQIEVKDKDGNLLIIDDEGPLYIVP